jgi:hypothetical protein
MKKFYFLLFVLAAFLTTNSNAQVTFFAKGGLNVNSLSYKSNESGSGSVTKDMTVGYNIGYQLKSQMKDSLFFQTGLFYSLKGGKLKGINNTNATYNLNYLIIPINLGYNYKKFDIYGGLYFGYFMWGIKDIGEPLRYNLVPAGNKYAVTPKYNQEAFSRIDLGVNIGVTYDLKFLKVGLGYDLGLYNLNVISKSDSKSGAKQSDLKMKNQTISLNIFIPAGK